MNGIEIWRGPSQIDGSPIVVIATGLKSGSQNAKTGNMVQTWILRADMSPVEAVKSGADTAICGDCRHKGDIPAGVPRSCYVTVWQAPRSIFESMGRGIYPVVKRGEARDILAGRIVRLGAYGDPAAVPFHVWRNVLRNVADVTGYTHAWKYCDSRFAQYCMASADSALEKALAEAKGYRVFRVKAADESRVPGEVVCPASAEAGKRTNCAACKACGGLSAKARAGIVINAHGIGAKHIGATH